MAIDNQNILNIELNSNGGKFGKIKTQTAVTPDYIFDNSYIGLKKFYNFIKGGASQEQSNFPTAFWYFCPFFYPSNDFIDSSDSSNYAKLLQDNFFYQNSSKLERLRYCINQIQFPSLTLKSDTGTNSLGSGVQGISTIYGTSNILGNAYVHPDKNTLVVQLMNTQSPLMEELIYPWLKETVRTTKAANQSLFPKLNMACKFWSAGRMEEDMEKVLPDFVYYITGLFPSTVDTIDANHSGGDKTNRTVNFIFNDFIILNNYDEAEKYGLGELFTV